MSLELCKRGKHDRTRRKYFIRRLKALVTESDMLGSPNASEAAVTSNSQSHKSTYNLLLRNIA